MNTEHQPQDLGSTALASSSQSHETKHDLVGGPFAVIESDPGEVLFPRFSTNLTYHRPIHQPHPQTWYPQSRGSRNV